MKQKMKTKRRYTLASAAALTLAAGAVLSWQQPPAQGAEQAGPAIAGVPNDVARTLNTYCTDCHGADKQKGNVRFDQLATLDPKQRVDLLTRANEALHFEEMPPSNKPQPSDAEREALSAWFATQLDASVDDKLKEKMRYPHYGNLVDHELLFSGEIDDKPYTPARRWLVSPQIFNERVMDVFELDGRERDHYAANAFYGVTNPFVLPTGSGVKDYDIGMLTGGHLLTMLSNAKWIASKQVFATMHAGADPKTLTHKNPKDNWYPRRFAPEAFKAVLDAAPTPTDEQLAAAVQKQFALVLRRPAGEEELAKYVDLMREMVQAVGNEIALQQMCTAVLLESDFLYRKEFGGGETDRWGRKKLTPREAAFAISYALGDRGPDEQLLLAAEEGRLQTKADYHRAVERLLDDESYYRGYVDPSLNCREYKSNIVSHPKIIRFFRDFFGYRNAANIFKDPPRSGGIYYNPKRGSLGTGGWLVKEADQIVTYHVENDRDVFENLLTSDEFYVYHNKSNEAGEKLIAQWRAMWEKLRDTDWREDPQAVLDANKDYLDKLHEQRVIQIGSGREGEEAISLKRWMVFFHETFGQGITPITIHPTTFGFRYYHSVFYSLPPAAIQQRYGWRTDLPKLDPDDVPAFWDYPVRQPFSIPNRKGILTHPAWLIAHSHNFHTDPIKRGRWIREKLLAGRVPDVPITVDAKVPEDPHRTFRERVVGVTAPDECWKCHKHMNPLGLPFEAYDDFGRYRTEEVMEHPDNLIKRGNDKTTFDVYTTKPIDTTGALDGTHDPKLDGPVDDPFELIDKLARSERVRQSFIRHAFRFYMGRNELLSDSQTLIDADNAYVESGGSFRAVIVSLLTSDSFMYRKDQP